MASATRNAIKQTCMKMLNERSLSQITVKALVEECGINIPALLNEIVMENADRLITEYAHVDSLEECLAAMTQFA